MIDPSGLWFLFTSSFLASTLLPGGSEAILLYAAYQGIESNTLLWSVATLGNTLGGITNWFIGAWLAKVVPGRQLEKPQQQKALVRIQKYGSPLLLLSWLPILGDPLCLAAGWARIRLLPAILFIGIGKGARYAILLYALPTGNGL